MTLKRALLPVVALTVVAACSDVPSAPTAASSTVIPSLDLLDPPPPPMTGTLLYGGTGDAGLSAPLAPNVAKLQSFSIASSSNAQSNKQDCTLATFCVPARYFINRPNNNEWLDVEAEEPLPPDIKQQLETVGAACGVATTDNSDVSVTLFCPVSGTSAGKIGTGKKGGGSGLAYDVSTDGLTATTVSLDQLDAFDGKALICRHAEGASYCSTPPVFGDVWAGTVGDRGQVTYTRVARVLSPFQFFGGSAQPPGDIVIP